MGDLIGIIIFSVLGGLTAAIIGCVIVYNRYKTKLQSPIYPVEHYTALNLSASSDSFVDRTVTRVRVTSNRKR